jgi:2',3'-cyclic-nucleotide 2'-phosphodiesterase (5'-nucleotidase family)
MQKLVALLSLCLLFSACKTNTFYVKTEHNYLSVKDAQDEDSTLINFIAPYKEQVGVEMNKIIGEVKMMITRGQPESSLGNWASDATFVQCEKYLGMKLDFAVLNLGGLRILSIPKGPITKGKLFELMPFDNTLVAVEMMGKDLPLLFDHIAKKGGWPVSKHIKMLIKDGKATQLTISGLAINPEKIYKIATNNYIANGGDKCAFFKDKKKLETGKLFRDGLIEYVMEETKGKRMLEASIEGRIQE